MKNRIVSLLLVVLLLLPALSASAEEIDSIPVHYTNFNGYAVRNRPQYYPAFATGDPLLVQAVTTYHWNDGQGAAPGTISIYDWDDHLIGTWNAVSRDGSGVQNVYWDVYPNIVLEAYKDYYIVDSDPSTWSCNDQSEGDGFVEVRGTENFVPEQSSTGYTADGVGGAVTETADAEQPTPLVGELQVAWNRGLIPACLLGSDLSQPITAAEFSALSVQLFEEIWQTQEIPEQTPYTNIAGHPLQREIEIAWGLGILKPIPAESFNPDTGFSRETMAQMYSNLVKACVYDGVNPDNVDSFTLPYTMTDRFADDGEINPAASDSVYFMAANRLMEAQPDGRFAPAEIATRETAIIVANRIYTMEAGGTIPETADEAQPTPLVGEPEAAGNGLTMPFTVSYSRTVESVTLEQTVYAPGQHMAVSYVGVTQEAADNGAWIAVARADDPASGYKDWKYVQPGSGTLWLDVPEEAGSYEIRYYPASRASEENLADGLRIPFTVAGSMPTDDTVMYPTRNDFDWDLLTFTPGTGSWDGTFETNFRTLYLHQSGNAVSGEYPDWDNGRMDGTAQDGIFYGYWYESPSYAPPGDAGQIICALYPDGQGFQGWWRYGNNGSWKDWSAGTRMPPEETYIPGGDGLLINGDASQDLYGWNDPDGIWVTSTDYVTAYDGPFFMPGSFLGSQGAKTRIYQDVAVGSYAGAESVFSAMVRTWDTNNTDETLLTVEFYDVYGNLLDTGSVTSAQNPEWHRISVTKTVPAGAATARLSLYAVYWYGSECDSYFDEVNFTVSGFSEARTAQRSAYDRIEGEGWDDAQGVSVASEGGGNAGYIDDGDWTAYYGVDFRSGASTFAVNASSRNEGGIIEIRLDAPDGPLAGECEVPGTGGWDTWRNFRCPLAGVSGVHDVYLVYRGSISYLLDVNYFWFEPAGTFDQNEIRQAAQRGIIPDCLLGTDLKEYIRATEFAALGVKLFEEFWQTQELRETTPFADVPGHPLQTEIEKAWGLGFLRYIRGDALEDGGLTRQLMAQMFCALIKAFEEDSWTYETDSQFPLAYVMPQPFADDADIFNSSRDSVYYLAANGIMGSVENDRFYPSSAATREQAIVAANRIWTLEQGDEGMLQDWQFFFDTEPANVGN